MKTIMTTDEIRQTPGDVLVRVSTHYKFDAARWVKVVKGDLLNQLRRHAQRFVVVETIESWRPSPTGGSWRYEMHFHGGYISRRIAEEAIKEDNDD